jgi:hypothetical protein
MDDGTVDQFVSITSTTPERAEQYLRLTDGDIQQAINLFFANEGNDAYDPTSAAQPESATQPAPERSEQARTSRERQNYKDEDGVVYIDSDQDISDKDEPQITGSIARRRQARSPGRPRSVIHAPSNITPPARPVANSVDDDEAMARRLQEEFYGGADPASEVGSDGVRAPLARTTETLVGPDSYDPMDRDEMREAVLEQMRARQRLRQRGIYTNAEEILASGC